jgi:hypothetical protein
LATFLDSNENYLICRKYGFLRNRVLLYRQDELRQLERDLLEADEDNLRDCPLALRSRKVADSRVDEEQTRKDLIRNIDSKLKEYGRHHRVPRDLEK